MICKYCMHYMFWGNKGYALGKACFFGNWLYFIIQQVGNSENDPVYLMGISCGFLIPHIVFNIIVFKKVRRVLFEDREHKLRGDSSDGGFSLLLRSVDKDNISIRDYLNNGDVSAEKKVNFENPDGENGEEAKSLKPLEFGSKDDEYNANNPEDSVDMMSKKKAMSSGCLMLRKLEMSNVDWVYKEAHSL